MATALNCLSLLKQRSTVLRFLYQLASKTGGRPPERPRLRRLFFWSSLTGMTALMRCSRRQAAAGPAQAAPGDADRVHQRDEPGGIAMLARTGQPGNRTAAQVSGQVNLGGQPATGPAQALAARFPVIR